MIFFLYKIIYFTEKRVDYSLAYRDSLKSFYPNKCNWWMRVEMVTMMEEKRELMGRKRFWRSGTVWESSMGISVSKTARTYTLSEELVKYCPVGLTGSSISPSSNASIPSNKQEKTLFRRSGSVCRNKFYCWVQFMNWSNIYKKRREREVCWGKLIKYLTLFGPL